MATAVGAGFDISKLLNSITKADEALTNLMNKNNQASRSIITSFQQIANQGVVPYTQSLEKSLSIYNSIRDAITDTSGKAKRGFGDMKSEIDKVITSTETLMTSLSMSPQFKYELQVKAARDYRDQMVRIYTEMFDTIEKRTTQNQSAKNNSQAYAQNYQQQLSAYERLFDEAIAREDKKKKEQADRDAKREAEEHKRKIDNINKRFELIERKNKRDAQRNTDYLNSPQGALAYSMYINTGVKSINTMNQALQQLRNAQANVNTNTEEGRQKYNELGVAIKRVETEMRAVSGASDEVKKKHSKLMDTSGQLMRAMAAIFSVSAIKGYINKLREVRGEFEMQQRSLQILLQNKDKANILWEKTIDLAVKSPFRVKELVTYTKQLAAYRVESDKLYDTTKMLADVSAGLGVDMNRLILAFGQVKAANFLRGTELRQFTEAGIPMLDELAKLFTELEGRAVSAGDVFERISKRMVTFGDVEEVFKRITSAGGVFYNMQEEQSKTLAGLYSNLHDSIDLMLNDMGKAYDGILKGSINVAKEFVENWREVSIVLAQIVAGLTAYKLSSAVFALGLKNTTNATLRFNNAMTLADAKAIGFTKTQFTLTKALTATKIAANGVKVAFLQIMLPALLIGGIAKLVQMMTKASREAKRLQKDLNAIFNEDASNLERQTDTFKDLVERLKDVNIGSKEHKNIISQLNNQYGEYLGFIVDEKTTYDQLASSINSVTTALVRKAKAASYEKALNKVYKSTNKEIEASTQIIEDIFTKGFERKDGGVKLIPTQQEINDIFNLIEKKVVDTGDVLTQGLNINDILSEYFEEEVAVQNPIARVYLDLSKSILKQKEAELNIQAKINSLYGEGVYSTKAYREEMEKLKSAKEEELSNTTSRSERDKIEYNYKVEEVRLQGRYEGLDDSAIQKRVDRIQKVSATVADINRRMGEEADKFGQDAIDRVYITFQDASQGVDAIAEQIAASYKSMQQEIKDQNALKEAGTIHDQEALDNATLMSKVYYRMLEIMGKTELAKEKGADSKELKQLKKQISLIREAARAYDDMRKLHDKAYADKQIVKEYGPAFKEAKLGDISGYAFGTRQDEQNNLEKLRASAEKTKDGVLELNKAIAQVGVNIADADQEIEDKRLFDSISDIFSNYEISLEMDKLNIPKDLASKLFGFDAINLDDIRGKVLEEFGMGDKVGLSNEGIYASDEYKNLSKEDRDKLRKALEEEEKLQNDYLERNLTKYIEYSKKALDERAKIKVDEIRQLNEIDKTFKMESTDGITDKKELERIRERNRLLKEQGDIARKAVQEKAFQQMKQIEWDEFRSSDVFNNMFKDLDKASEMSINAAIKRIQDFKKEWKDMPVDAAKEMLRKLNELQLSLYDSSNVRVDKKKIEETLNKEIEKRGLQGKANTTIGQQNLSEAIQGQNQAYTEIIEKSNKRIELLQLINSLEGTNKQEQLNKIGYTIEYLDALGITTEMVENSAQANEEIISQEQDKINKTNSLISNNQLILNLIKKQKSKAQELGEVWSKSLGMAKDLYTSFQDIAEAANWDFSDEMAIFGEMGMSMADAVINAIALSSQLAAVETGAIAAGTALNTALGVVGLIVMAVQLIVSALNAISKFNQKKRANEIEKEAKTIEDLSQKYKDLEEAIKKAYKASELEANSKEAQKNIQDQIDATNRQIAVLKSAKKLSKEEEEQLKGLKNDVIELENQLEVLKEDVVSISTAGILDDISSAADDFVDAWLTAFEEAGDGIKGFEDNFEEMLKTLLKKQMSLQIMGAFVEGWKKSLSKYVNEDDVTLTAQEAGLFAKDVKESFNNANESLLNYVEALEREGISFRGDGDGEDKLSGLQAGIQGITEEQADVLEGYWNQVRFDVSWIRQKFEEYTSKMFIDTENPMLEQLKNIVTQTSTIAKNTEAISGLINQNGSNGSDGIRVYVNNM